MTNFHVDSEVGRLRRVLLHRPDLELSRLTPTNASELLFDEVLWVKRARQEHDVFADTLRQEGVEVLYLHELLAETLKDDDARSWVLDRDVCADELGVDLAARLRTHLEDMDPDTLARHLIGGLAARELPFRADGLRFAILRDSEFVLPPLPNHLFTRDTSCWIYEGVSINPMAMRARRRETEHLDAIYRFHPLFAAATFPVWYGPDGATAATVEGGDVLVIGNGAVLIGMGERTTPQAVETLSRHLFAAGAARTVLAVRLPKERAFMHLDTVMTMIDEATFVAYPGVAAALRCWSVAPGEEPGR